MRLLPILLCLMLLSCNNQETKTLTGPILLDLAIEAAGGAQFFQSEITFDVNDFSYTMYRKDHIANFSVETQRDTMKYLATYKNGFPEYFINGVAKELDAISKGFIDRDLDAFLYLTSVPHVFKQNGLTITLLEDVSIQKKNYHTLHIIVPQGDDVPSDEFYLYIDPETYYIHFASEKYLLNGNRPTFKRFYNHRLVNGQLFSDYYTFYPLTPETSLNKLYEAYGSRQIREGIDVSYKNINVAYHTYE